MNLVQVHLFVDGDHHILIDSVLYLYCEYLFIL